MADISKYPLSPISGTGALAPRCDGIERGSILSAETAAIGRKPSHAVLSGAGIFCQIGVDLRNDVINVAVHCPPIRKRRPGCPLIGVDRN
jgi:hypothetical protein